MNKFVVKNEGPPPSLVVYRRQVLAQSTRQGDLWLTRYPLSHELFKENLGVDYAGCGALWREAQPGALPPRVAQEQFNALWKTRIKALEPKEQPKAVEALRLSLVAQAQVQHNKADEALVAQLPRILVHERAALVGMLPGPARVEHQRRLDVLEVVCTAWAQLPATAKSVTALGQLFQKAGTPAADAPSSSSPSAVATVASSQAATSIDRSLSPGPATARLEERRTLKYSGLRPPASSARIELSSTPAMLADDRSRLSAAACKV